MRILHLCLGNFFIDNYSYQENMLPKYHVKQGHDVLVITSLFTYNAEGKGSYLAEPSRYYDNNGFEVIRLANKKPTKWNRFFRHFVGLEECVVDFAPDCIFVHNTAFGDTPILRRYLRKHPNVKLFADCHADYVNSAKNWWSRHILHPIIWRHYTKIIEPFMVRCYGVTPMRCRFLKEMYHVNPEIVDYLPLGVDDDLIPSNRNEIRERMRKELQLGEDSFLIFTGGKIDRLKNTDVLIDALDILKNPRLHLVICGLLTPEMEKLNELFGRNSHLHYLGWCDAQKVMDCMMASDLACFPGTHSTLWEQAVGVELPAVFKRWPEMEHVNVNGNCLFVKGDDAMELATTLDSVVNDEEKYADLLEKSKDASRSFLYSEIARKAIVI